MTKEKSNDTGEQIVESNPASDVSGEWQELFDGKSKDGWHVYNNKSDGSAWEVVDGVLHLNPKEIMVTPVQGAEDLSRAMHGGDIVTDEEFDNFHLKLKFKVGNPSDSGIMLFVKENPEHEFPWQTGPEIQIMHHRKCTEKHNTCVGDWMV